jgi:hypothetical protein
MAGAVYKEIGVHSGPPGKVTSATSESSLGRERRVGRAPSITFDSLQWRPIPGTIW